MSHLLSTCNNLNFLLSQSAFSVKCINNEVTKLCTFNTAKRVTHFRCHSNKFIKHNLPFLIISKLIKDIYGVFKNNPQMSLRIPWEDSKMFVKHIEYFIIQHSVKQPDNQN
ncbi:hypothetical protein ACROYT_G019194, partial [Oculina patagonica]